MQNNTVPPEILQRIQEILNRTTDKGCTPAEAEEAVKIAQKLLLKYNLTMSDVHGHRKKGKREFTKSFFDFEGKQKRHDSTWVTSLVHVISKHNLSQAILFQGTTRIVIIGEIHNVEIILYLVDQLIPRIEKACSYAWSVYWGEEKRNTFRRGFLSGCVAGINVKLREQAAQMAAEENSMLALIKVSNTELTEYVKSEYELAAPNKKAGKLRKSQDSKYLGFEAGKNMQINRGLDDTKGDPKLLS